METRSLLCVHKAKCLSAAQCEWMQIWRVDSNRSLRFPAPSGWKCQKCEMRENLWLNLTDGAVFCGKWFFDGSGGNGHALDHYKDTNHPLAVKLDTITPDGAGTAHMLNCTLILLFLGHKVAVKSLNHTCWFCCCCWWYFYEQQLMFSFQMFTHLRRRKPSWILLYQNTYRTLELTCCRCKAG